MRNNNLSIQNKVYEYEYKKVDWDAWEKEWDLRKESEFGKLLTELNEIVFDMFGDYDEYGFKTTPISNIILDYFDGENNLMRLINNIKRVLENYDMMQEDDVKIIINKLIRIAKTNNKAVKISESLNEAETRNGLYKYSVAFSDLKDEDGLPISVTCIVDKSERNAFEKFLEDYHYDYIYNACGINNYFELED